MGSGIVKMSWTTVILPPYSSSIILGYLIYRKTFTHSCTMEPCLSGQKGFSDNDHRLCPRAWMVWVYQTTYQKTFLPTDPNRDHPRYWSGSVYFFRRAGAGRKNTIFSLCAEILREYRIKKRYLKPYFWSESYFITTVGENSLSAVEEYIKNQGTK